MCIIFQLILVCYMYCSVYIDIYIHLEHGRQGWGGVCVWRSGAVGAGGGGGEEEAVLRV